MAENVSRRARAMCDGRASARVLSDKSVWGGSPIGGPARRHCAKAELARRARSPAPKAAKGNIVICKDVMYYCNISPEVF
jgi:hypothetical protein